MTNYVTTYNVHSAVVMDTSVVMHVNMTCMYGQAALDMSSVVGVSAIVGVSSVVGVSAVVGMSSVVGVSAVVGVSVVGVSPVGNVLTIVSSWNSSSCPYLQRKVTCSDMPLQSKSSLCPSVIVTMSLSVQ